MARNKKKFKDPNHSSTFMVLYVPADNPTGPPQQYAATAKNIAKAREACLAAKPGATILTVR